jgi:hypothetical protein
MRDVYPQVELDADTLDETWGDLRTLAQVGDYIKNLIASADAEPEGLYVGQSGAFEFNRTASRLTEMRGWKRKRDSEHRF